MAACVLVDQVFTEAKLSVLKLLTFELAVKRAILILLEDIVTDAPPVEEIDLYVNWLNPFTTLEPENIDRPEPDTEPENVIDVFGGI